MTDINKKLTEDLKKARESGVKPYLVVGENIYIGKLENNKFIPTIMKNKEQFKKRKIEELINSNSSVCFSNVKMGIIGHKDTVRNYKSAIEALKTIGFNGCYDIVKNHLNPNIRDPPYFLFNGNKYALMLQSLDPENKFLEIIENKETTNVPKTFIVFNPSDPSETPTISDGSEKYNVSKKSAFRKILPKPVEHKVKIFPDHIGKIK